MDARNYTLVNRPFVQAITVPVLASPATVESLATGLAAFLATLPPHARVVSFSIEQGASDIYWGHAADSALAKIASGANKDFPTLGIDSTYVKSGTAATVAAVLVAWIAW